MDNYKTMKYKLGDFVRFVDEKMEGFVTRIIDEQMIGVTGTDDFEIPVPASKVTFVHGYNQPQTSGEDANDIAAYNKGEFKTKGITLAVINDTKARSVVHFTLVNETSFHLLFALSTKNQDKYKGEFSSIISPVSAVKIYSAQLADLQVWPELIIHSIYFTLANQAVPVPLIINQKFKAKDFSGAKKLVPVTGDNGWLFQLDKPEVIIDAKKLKESFFETAEEKAVIIRPAPEVDLHIEKLRDDYRFLNSGEILNIQVNHFNKMLDAAIVHQLPEIVFIHGAGHGILRHELHKALSKHQKIETFMDARKEKFGYGATKVLLK